MEKAQSTNSKRRSFQRYSNLQQDFNLPSLPKQSHENESFENETLLVTGIGAVGLGALVAGKMLKFGKVIACDLNESRLKMAKDEIQVDELVNPKEFKDSEEFIAYIKSKSKDGRGATLVVEASGSPKAIKDSVLSLAIGGKALIVGSPPPTALMEVPIGLILVSSAEMKLFSSIGAKLTILLSSCMIISKGKYLDR